MTGKFAGGEEEEEEEEKGSGTMDKINLVEKKPVFSLDFVTKCKKKKPVMYVARRANPGRLRQ